MKKWIRPLVVVALIVAVVALWSGHRSHTALAASDDTFPAFNVTDLDGNPLSLDSMKKKVTIVNFWATWCPPCRKEIPHFIELQKKYQGKVQFIGLSVDRDSAEKVKKWTTENDVNYPIARVNNDFQEPYQNLLPEEDRGGIPYTFVLDKNGKIVDRLVGYRPLEYWESTIKKLLK